MSTPTDVRYTERLWPSAGTWLVVLVLGSGLAVSVWPLGAAATSSVLVVGLALAGAGLAQASPVLQVADGELRAGRASIPLSLLGEVSVHHGEQARQERGPRLDARAYLLLRGWVGPVVRVQVADPHDPTPYWLLSTRHPEQLAAVLEDGSAPRDPVDRSPTSEGTTPPG